MNLVRMFAQTSVLASMVLSSLSIYSNPVSAQQRACVITDEGTTVCGKLTTPTKKPNSNPGYRKEVDDFVFLLRGCNRSGENVRCNLIITNKRSERTLEINRANCKIVDSTGKSHYSPILDLDGKIGNNDSYPQVNIAPGVEYATVFVFKDIPEQITRSQLLEISLQNRKSVQFRNVSFSN
jgi:hypothetical protein